MKLTPIQKAFLDVDQIAEDLIRLIIEDPKYEDRAESALKQIMKIKEDLLEATS